MSDSPTSIPTNPANTHVTVIGAGIVGINCALELIKQGFKVTVIDKVEPGDSCSFGNAGILAAWSFAPIFGPEVLGSVPRWLIDPTGPLAIRWTRLPQILPWLLRMLPKANAAHIRHASDAMHHLTMGCAEAYRELAAEAGVPEVVNQDQVLQVYDTETDFQKAEADLAFRGEYGVKYDAIGRDALADLEPDLDVRFRWAHVLKGGGTTTNPGRLTKAMADLFRKRGGTIVQAEVRNLRHLQGGGFAIEMAAGETTTDRLVIAAGAFSHRLARCLGDHFPLGTERGYHALFAEPGVRVNHFVGWKARAFYASPMEMGLRFAGTVELAGHDAPPNYKRAEIIAGHARTMFPKMTGAVTSQWMGFRPTLPDSMPIIGASDHVPGLFYAFGHQHVGLTCGPATGRIIGKLLKGEAPNLDLTPFRAGRF